MEARNMNAKEQAQKLLDNEKDGWTHEFWNDEPSYDDHGRYYERGRIDALEELLKILED